jgi:hypothetical protein
LKKKITISLCHPGLDPGSRKEPLQHGAVLAFSAWCYTFFIGNREKGTCLPAYGGTPFLFHFPLKGRNRRYKKYSVFIVSKIAKSLGAPMEELLK